MTTAELLHALVSGQAEVPAGPATVAVAAGFAEYIPCTSLDEALSNRANGTRALRITELGKRRLDQLSTSQLVSA